MYAAFAALALTLAPAVPLPPETPPPGVAVPRALDVAGDVVLDRLASGTFVTIVTRRTDGGLTFVYQSPDDARPAPGRTPTFTVTGFAGVAVDVTYANPVHVATALGDWRLLWDPQTSTAVGYRATRTGDEITFHMALNPGHDGFDRTDALVLRTDATDYRPGTARVGGFAPPSFSPNPEPSSLALFGGCLAGLAVAWRRRHASPPAERNASTSLRA